MNFDTKTVLIGGAILGVIMFLIWNMFFNKKSQQKVAEDEESQEPQQTQDQQQSEPQQEAPRILKV